MRSLLNVTIMPALLGGLLGPAVAFGDGDAGPKLANETSVERWKIGMVVTAQSGPCADLVGTVTLPVDWPEQDVKVLEEELSPFASQLTYREVDTVRQMLISIGQLPNNQEASIILTYEIRRRSQLPPDDTVSLVKPDPKKVPKDIRPYLGPSPSIETQSGKIKALAKRILQQSSTTETDWQKVEALFDWVRNNIEVRDKQPQPGAVQTLRDKASNHEGLCWLFIALCRNSGIPARTVWVPKYCYPEFYLQDADGNGYWFPCRVAGTREFGGINEHRPIWQKGDNFRVPEKPRAVLTYIPPDITGKGGEPSVKFVREIIANGL
ncbi:MAG TPA: transglutaminase-like domain-containing protein [Pirellulales bacterium]|nr:transglutaminase-like domain-containing protein [Pirellulales bacterium]